MKRLALFLLILLGLVPSVSASAEEIVVDNGGTGTSSSGYWYPATAASQHHGSVSSYAVVGGAVDVYRFTPTIASAGRFAVYAWNSCFSPRARNVPHRVIHAAGASVVTVDQDCATGSHGVWLALGEFDFQAGTGGRVEISDQGVTTGSYIGADAVRFVRVGSAPPPPPGDTTPPVAGNGAPSGTLPAGTSPVKLSVTTNENAACRYATQVGTAYASMASFATTGGTSHATNLYGLSAGSHSYFVRCQDAAGNTATSDYPISFSIAAATPPPSPSPQDDEFEGSALSGWTFVNPGMFDVALVGGKLRMTPKPSVCDWAPHCVWFHADTGPLLHRTISGNFKVTTAVEARSAKDPSKPVPPEFQFAGLLARDPASDASGVENYVFTVMGDRGGYYTNEVKSTVNDVSSVHGPDTGRTHADAELRICRVGGTFYFYNRPIGGTTWALEHTVTRSLPTTLQVGPTAYTWTDSTDLAGFFAYVRFAPVTSLADCTKD